MKLLMLCLGGHIFATAPCNIKIALNQYSVWGWIGMNWHRLQSSENRGSL